MQYFSHVFLKIQTMLGHKLNLISNQMNKLSFTYGKLLAYSAENQVIIHLQCIQNNGTVGHHIHQEMDIHSKTNTVTYFSEEANTADFLA